jgi:uncharacterized protein (TIGR03118 family)
MNRLVMLPGAHYNTPVFSVRAEFPPAGLGFLTSSALGPQYQNLLFEGGARDLATSGGQELHDGALFVFNLNSDRTGLDFGGDPNVRTTDNVFENSRDFDLNGDTSFLLGEGFGIGTDIVTGPNGDLYVVSETKGLVLEIYSKANVAVFHQTNLVSDIANPVGGAPEKMDANLENPWGISFSATSPFWVSNQHTNTSTLYAGDRTQLDGSITPITVNALVVTVPSPTGQIRNGTTDFKLNNNNPASFIFDTLGGAIYGWNAGTAAELKTTVTGASYTGLANGTSSTGANFLYAANHNTGKIDVFDKNFQITTLGGNFEDPNLPPGSPFRAFNVQNLGGTLYVAYDKVVTVGGVTDREHDGVVDAFDTDGHFLNRVVTGGVNAPWGLALAPDNFGAFSNDLLVGNFGFGDGRINAYQLDPATGAGTFVGNISDANNNPIALEGLWAITFGNGGSGGDTNALYFAAGIGRTGPNSFGAAHGLFGSIRFGPSPGPSVADGGGGDGGSPAAVVNPGILGIPGSSPAAAAKVGPAAIPPDGGLNFGLLGIGSQVVAALLSSATLSASTSPESPAGNTVPSPAQPPPNSDSVNQVFSSAQVPGDMLAPLTSAPASGQADGQGLDLVWGDPLASA